MGTGAVWAVAGVEGFGAPELRFAMAYRIQFFKDGRELEGMDLDRPLPDVRTAAIDWLTLNRGDYAAILDLNDTVKLIETVKKRA